MFKSVSHQDDDDYSRMNIGNLQKQYSHHSQHKQLSSPVKPFKFHGLSSQSIYNAQAMADQDEIQNISFSENIDESPQKVQWMEDSQEVDNSQLADYDARESDLKVATAVMGIINSNTKVLDQDIHNIKLEDLVSLQQNEYIKDEIPHSDSQYLLSNFQLEQLKSNNNNSQGLLESPQIQYEPDSIEFIEEEHFKIYEFRLNENNAKSVISSTDRKHPYPQPQQLQIQQPSSQSQNEDQPYKQGQPNQFMTYNQKHFNKQLMKQNESQQNSIKQYATSFNSPGHKISNKIDSLQQHNMINSKANSSQDISKLIGSLGQLNQQNNNQLNNKSNITEDLVENDDSSFEFEIKNLDTNEIFKMHVPVTPSNDNSISKNQLNSIPTTKIDLNYASKRRAQGISQYSQDNNQVQQMQKQPSNEHQDTNNNIIGSVSNLQQRNQQNTTQNLSTNATTLGNEKVEQQLEKINSPNSKQPNENSSYKHKLYELQKTNLHKNFDVSSDMRDGQGDQKVDDDKTSLITQRNVKPKQPEDPKIIRQNTQKLLMLKKISLSQDDKTVDLYNFQDRNKEITQETNDQINLLPQISEDKKLKLIKEIYTSSINYTNPYGEYCDLLPQYQEECHEYQEKVINFEQIEEYYENFNDYQQIKHKYLRNYMDIQSSQIRKQQKKQKESNDVIVCIRNSVLKHVSSNEDLDDNKFHFDLEKTRQKWNNCALQIVPQNIKDNLQLKIDQTQNASNLTQKVLKVKQCTQIPNEPWSHIIGFVDNLGIYQIENLEHHVHIDERNFFSKMMWFDRIKLEKEAKIEAYKILREVIEIEMRKFELWGLYVQQVNCILNFDYFNQEEAVIREHVFKEGLFGIFNPLLQE